MSATARRRQRLLELLARHEITSQARLQELLAGEGIAATQSQISRDLRALHVAKRDGAYRASERVTPLQRLTMLLRDARTAGPNLVVVTCEPGGANAVARALEAEDVEGLIGTVAGDDTLFAAVEDEARGRALRDWLLGLLA